MNAAKFTKGPWAIHPEKTQFDELRISYKGPKGHDLILAHVFDGDEFDSDMANAKLIASAPTLHAENENLRAVNAELLAALRFIQCDAILTVNDAREISTAAISRATGGGK